MSLIEIFILSHHHLAFEKFFLGASNIIHSVEISKKYLEVCVYPNSSKIIDNCTGALLLCLQSVIFYSLQPRKHKGVQQKCSHLCKACNREKSHCTELHEGTHAQVSVWCTRGMHGFNIKVDTGNKEPTCGYQNCNTKQILKFGGYVNVRESLVGMSTWVIISKGQCHSQPY